VNGFAIGIHTAQSTRLQSPFHGILALSATMQTSAAFSHAKLTNSNACFRNHHNRIDIHKELGQLSDAPARTALAIFSHHDLHPYKLSKPQATI